MTERQAITLDWFQVHFRLDDPMLIGALPAATTDHPDQDRKTSMSSSNSAGSNPWRQGPEKIAIGKTVFKRLRNGNQFYRDFYGIFHNGNRFGNMLSGVQPKYNMPLNDVQIEVANNKLYENDWLNSLRKIASDLGGTFHNFTRLDIAIDGGKFFETHERMKAKEIVLIGRAAVNDYYIRKKGSPDRVINGYYIGSRKSSKSIKVYNKTNELTRSNKRYIENYWKQNNIDTSRDVQRMELTMRNDESKKYDDIDWNKLDQPSHLASIMKSNMSKFAEYRIPHGKNSARWPKVEMINWNQLCGETLPKNSTMPSNEVWSAKVTCKKLFEIHYISSDQQFFDVAYEIAINCDIVDWFSKMQPYWIKDLETKARSAGGDLEALPWKYHFKRYHAGEKIIMFEP
jgi:hypothetical protein